MYFDQFERYYPKELGVGAYNYGNAEKSEPSSQYQVDNYRMNQDYLRNHVWIYVL